MEIMKNWLSPIPAKPAVPVKADSTALSRAEFDRKIASFRKASGVVETWQIGFLCAKTSQRFETLFERGSPSELFRIASIDKLVPAFGPGKAGAPPAQANFPIEQFCFDRWRCAGCGAGSFIKCQTCQLYYCDAFAEERRDGTYSYCPKCRGGGRTVLLQDLDASGAARHRRPQIAAGADRPRLTQTASAPALPWQRR
jgi:hypothetical protein